MVHYVANACTKEACNRGDAMRAIEDAILSGHSHRLMGFRSAGKKMFEGLGFGEIGEF